MERRAILGGTFNPPHVGHLAIASAALEQAALQQVIWVPAAQPPHRTRDSLPERHHRVEMIRRAIAPYSTFSLTTVEGDRLSPSYAIDTLIELQRQYPVSQWYWIIGLDAFQTLPRWYRRLELIPRCTWLVAPRAVGTVQNQTTPAEMTQTTQATQTHQTDLLDPPDNELENYPDTTNPTAIPTVSAQTVGRPPVFENSSQIWTGEGGNASLEPHLLRSTLISICQRVVQQLASQQMAIQWQLLDMPLLTVSSSLIRQQWGDRHLISTLVPTAVQAYIQQHQLYPVVQAEG